MLMTRPSSKWVDLSSLLRGVAERRNDAVTSQPALLPLFLSREQMTLKDLRKLPRDHMVMSAHYRVGTGEI